MRTHLIRAAGLVGVLAVAASAAAHCQIPCGIYDDELRVQLMEEHITTVEKSMREIESLAKTAPVNYNQLVRWVDNKETHAQEIQDIVTAYFMAQRIKAPAATEGKEWDDYIAKLTVLHALQVEAMKAKQTTDFAHVAAMRELVTKFRRLYFGEEKGHAH